jgi:4-hydroxy-tetrahydrodipicolinate synthase
MDFTGVWTALVTPFEDGNVDAAALDRILQIQFTSGVSGVVPVGTTGESPTLSHEEHIRVIELVVEICKGKLPVMAGTGSNCTSEAVELTQGAERAGARAALVVAPYYNKPTQEGLYQHYRTIAQSTDLPIILYSIPSRCGVEISAHTVARLAAACPNIVGLKEAGGRVERIREIKPLVPPNFALLSGDDALTLDFISAGACGVISVASNIIPSEIVRYVKLALQGQIAEARRIHTELEPLFRDLFIETNPVPIKAALHAKGLCSEEVRLPLVPLSETNKEQLLNTLRKGGWL